MLTWRNGALVEQSPFVEACAEMDKIQRPRTPRERYMAKAQEICAKHNCTIEQMISVKRRYMPARMEFAIYLDNQGLTQTQIGDIINRERSTVSYFLNRAYRLERQREKTRRARDATKS